MGIRGQRPTRKKKEKHSEPELVVSVDDIIDKSVEEGYVDENENIEIEEVAKWNGIEIFYEDMESTKSGYLKNFDDKWIIGVNKKHNPRRQRFTIAHELGHFYMHRNKNIDFEDTTFFRSDNSTSIEFAANEFAAKLLMPENRIKIEIEGGVKNIEKLAKIFNVSAAAIKYRVISLGYKMKVHE